MADSAQLPNENSVEYCIYTFSNGDVPTIALKDVLCFVLDQSSNYVWHNECFKLAEKELPVRHFYGITDFGENYDDEWYIVHLLMQLTTKFPDIVVRTRDSDGEFMLIEAADFLPRWINKSSTNVQNRVFLHNGAVHVIPRSKQSSTPCFPDVVETPYEGALLVQRYPHLTVADSSLHLCIEKKIGSIMDNLDEKFHYAVCYMPAKAAFILRQHPQIVSAAVQAFYSRDPVDLKYCRERTYFPHEKIIPQRVKFTRHLYAMLMKQKFNPDRQSTWKFPPADDPLYKKHHLGLKLTCGLEILCRRKDDCKIVTNFSRNETSWDNFLASLTKNGYFKNEIQGSKKYNEAHQRAKCFFDEQYADKNNNSGTIIFSVLQTFNENSIEEMKKESEDSLDDDDSWLNVTPEMLDEIFTTKSSGFSEAFKESKHNKSSRKRINEEICKFVNTRGMYDGANLPSNVAMPASSSNVLPYEISMKNEILDLNMPPSSSDSSDMESYGSDNAENSDLDEDELKEMEKWGEVMRDYMKQMDQELQHTKVGHSFITTKNKEANSTKHEISQNGKSSSTNPAGHDFYDSSIDIDKNLAKNLLTSYQMECGEPGPASTLLHGLKLLPSTIRKAALDSDDDTEGSEID